MSVSTGMSAEEEQQIQPEQHQVHWPNRILGDPPQVDRLVDGMEVDVLDAAGVWSQARILESNDEIVKVHYDGWCGEVWDEKLALSMSSFRIAPRYTYTRRAKCTIPIRLQLLSKKGKRLKSVVRHWPSVVHFRMPDPHGRDFLSPKNVLRTGNQLFFVPYAPHLLLPNLWKKKKMEKFCIDGGIWMNQPCLQPWRSYKEDELLRLEVNLREAVMTGMADNEVSVAITSNVLDQGVLLKEQYLVRAEESIEPTCNDVDQGGSSCNNVDQGAGISQEEDATTDEDMYNSSPDDQTSVWTEEEDIPFAEDDLELTGTVMESTKSYDRKKQGVQAKRKTNTVGHGGASLLYSSQKPAPKIVVHSRTGGKFGFACNGFEDEPVMSDEDSLTSSSHQQSVISMQQWNLNLSTGHDQQVNGNLFDKDSESISFPSIEQSHFDEKNDSVSSEEHHDWELMNEKDDASQGEMMFQILDQVETGGNDHPSIKSASEKESTWKTATEEDEEPGGNDGPNIRSASPTESHRKATTRADAATVPANQQHSECVRELEASGEFIENESNESESASEPTGSLPLSKMPRTLKNETLPSYVIESLASPSIAPTYVGEEIDVLDMDGVWTAARILESAPKFVRVHFIGWPEEVWDYCLRFPDNEHHVAHRYTHTRRWKCLVHLSTERCNGKQLSVLWPCQVLLRVPNLSETSNQFYSLRNAKQVFVVPYKVDDLQRSLLGQVLCGQLIDGGIWVGVGSLKPWNDFSFNESSLLGRSANNAFRNANDDVSFLMSSDLFEEGALLRRNFILDCAEGENIAASTDKDEVQNSGCMSMEVNQVPKDGSTEIPSTVSCSGSLQSASRLLDTEGEVVQGDVELGNGECTPKLMKGNYFRSSSCKDDESKPSPSIALTHPKPDYPLRHLQMSNTTLAMTNVSNSVLTANSCESIPSQPPVSNFLQSQQQDSLLESCAVISPSPMKPIRRVLRVSSVISQSPRGTLQEACCGLDAKSPSSSLSNSPSPEAHRKKEVSKLDVSAKCDTTHYLPMKRKRGRPLPSNVFAMADKRTRDIDLQLPATPAYFQSQPSCSQLRPSCLDGDSDSNSRSESKDECQSSASLSGPSEIDAPQEMHSIVSNRLNQGNQLSMPMVIETTESTAWDDEPQSVGDLDPGEELLPDEKLEPDEELLSDEKLEPGEIFEPGKERKHSNNEMARLTETVGASFAHGGIESSSATSTKRLLQPCYVDESEFLPHVGLEVDVLDSIGCWSGGQIVEVKNNSAFKVHFFGLPSEHDEEVEAQRLAPRFSRTIRLKCNFQLLKGKGKGSDLLWPCQIHFRIPESKHEPFTCAWLSKSQLFVKPYGSNKLPPAGHGKHIDGGFLVDRKFIKPWQDFDQLLDSLDLNLREAYLEGRDDYGVSVLLITDNFFKKRILLREDFISGRGMPLNDPGEGNSGAPDATQD